MKTLCRDLWTSFLMGLVIPSLLLNLGSLYLPREEKRAVMFASAEVAEIASVRTDSVALPVLVRMDGELPVQMDMDTYLTGVVLAEMPVSFEPEALKAQSAVARTYARKAYITGGKHGDGSVCTRATCCQAYKDAERFLAEGGREEDLAKVRKAVRATSGYVLTYEGSLIEATYFSCSGGSTEDAQAVWGTDFPYLRAVSSPGEEDALYYTDTVWFSREDFARKLGLTEGGSFRISDLVYTPGGGVDSLVVCGKTFRGTRLRELLGLRSTAFSLELSGGGITITTRGYGHRVGMSQYGAEAMAVSGSTWQEILLHYYQGVQLQRLLPENVSQAIIHQS